MTAPAKSLAIGSVLAGKYRIERVLGEGGMGAVYLAENLDISRKVAIKVLHAALGRDEDVLKRFRQEARASAVIAHPNIVDVLDMGLTADGEAFIVMERLVGETLAARQRRRGKLAVGEVAAIMCEVLDGLAAAHAKGFIHRDLKPENIFLTWQPRWGVKILDFGISRVIGADELRVTASNVVMGSVLYMAPEQAKDVRMAGVEADLYAIGVILYQLLVGLPPFHGTSYAEVMAALLVDVPPPIGDRVPELPAELATMIDALLAKDPARRPGPARAVHAALLAAAGGTLPAVDEPPPPAPAAAAPFDPLAATAAPESTTAPRGSTIAASVAASVAVVPTEAPVTQPPPRRNRRTAIALAAVVLAGGALAVILATRDPGGAAPHDAAPGDARPVDAHPVDAPTDAPVDARVIDAPIPDAPPDGRPPPLRADAHPAATPVIVHDAAPADPKKPDAFIYLQIPDPSP